MLGCKELFTVPDVSGQSIAPLKMAQTGFPKTSATNYQSAMRNIPEEQKFILLPLALKPTVGFVERRLHIL
jgi:hypothetical protein